MKKTKPLITSRQYIRYIRGINRKFLSPTILAFIFILTASLFSIVAAGPEPLLVRVGAYANNPKIFMNANGKVSGFWPDLVEEIAEKENWKIEYIWGTWSEGLDHLMNGEIDVMPDVAFTEKRNKLYTFSKAPVLMSWTRVYVNKEKTEIQSICDLKDKKIAALRGSVNLEGSGGLREIARGFNLNCTFLELDNYTEVFKAVEENRVDAGITNRDFGSKNVNNFKVKKTPIIFQPINIKFAFPKDAELTPYLVKRINYHIKQLKEDEYSLYYRLLEKYFEAEIAEKRVEVSPGWLSTLLRSITVLLIFFILVIIASRVQIKRKTNEITAKNEALQISEQRYRCLFDDSPISLWEEDFSAIKKQIDRLRDSGITDFRLYFKDHPEAVRKYAEMVKVVDVNKETLEMFEAESKIELLENLVLIFGKESYEVFREELITLAEGNNNFKSEAVNKTLQGREIHVSLLLSIVPGFEDSWSRVLITLSDITGQVHAEVELKKHREHLKEMVEKRTKELKEKSGKIEESRKALTYLMEDVNVSREKLQKVNNDYVTANNELKEFAYIVSHDLKAPLRAISQLTHWISEDYAEVFDDDGREQMDLILKRVKRMDGLIDGVLRYSRIGRVKEKEEELDLNLLVNEVIENLAPPDNIQITLENKLPVVLRDPTRMGQVFQNLIGNAIKFMDKDEGVINVSCVDEGELWKFTVSDNGPGIDKRYHDKIFQIFQTLKARDEHESTGIGLTLVKKIITLYGGSIRVESEVGKGSAFIFIFPKK
ncbi:MAG: transporter substrate-binding domain-containing protein [Deltaproteobacteria bacterium]|nr:transporter substrate-binding domain-containing protein [Candidatus Tharpella aukensis]